MEGSVNGSVHGPNGGERIAVHWVRVTLAGATLESRCTGHAAHAMLPSAGGRGDLAPLAIVFRYGYAARALSHRYSAREGRWTAYRSNTC